MPIGGKDAFLSKVTFRRESKWYSKTKQELKELKNMATIEERAKEYSLKDFDGYYTGREKALEEGYIAGATEQKDIDINKACEAYEKELRKMKKMLNESIEGDGKIISVGKALSEFRKAMEE